MRTSLTCDWERSKYVIHMIIWPTVDHSPSIARESTIKCEDGLITSA